MVQNANPVNRENMTLPTVSKEVCQTIGVQSQRNSEYIHELIGQLIMEQSHLWYGLFAHANNIREDMVEKGVDPKLAAQIETNTLAMCAIMYKSLKNQIEANELEQQSKA